MAAVYIVVIARRMGQGGPFTVEASGALSQLEDAIKTRDALKARAHFVYCGLFLWTPLDGLVEVDPNAEQRGMLQVAPNAGPELEYRVRHACWIWLRDRGLKDPSYLF